MSRVYLSPPDVGELEERYLVHALRSGWAAPVGPDLDAFEREIADQVGVGARAGALLRHRGPAPGPAGARGTRPRPGGGAHSHLRGHRQRGQLPGAEPVFVDCDPETGNLDVALVGQVLEAARSRGRRVGAVVPVDLFGTCADYRELLPMCAGYDVPVLEDAAEALGAWTDGHPAGSFGQAGVLSFNGNKIITTSGGGMLVSDDRELIERCRYLATQARQPVAHYEHTDIGYNYRLSNLLAALGRAQLARLDELIEPPPGAARAVPQAVRPAARRAAARRRRRRRQLLADHHRGGPGTGRLGRLGAGAAAGRRRHRDPAGVEADAPAAGVRGPPGAAHRGRRSGCSRPAWRCPAAPRWTKPAITRVLEGIDGFLRERLGPGWSS